MKYYKMLTIPTSILRQYEDGRVEMVQCNDGHGWTSSFIANTDIPITEQEAYTTLGVPLPAKKRETKYWKSKHNIVVTRNRCGHWSFRSHDGDWVNFSGGPKNRYFDPDDAPCTKEEAEQILGIKL